MLNNKPELVVLALDGAVPSYIKKMVEENKLPAFKKLMERGCWFSDCRPPFPSITPTCWASFSTGATPATHGATCQDRHIPGTPLDEVVTAYHSENIYAERFWEAAQRAGKKSLIIQLPTSGPAKVDNVLQIAGAGCSTIDASPPHKPTIPSEQDKSIRYIIPSQLFLSSDERDQKVQWIHRSPASGQWQPDEKRHIHNIDITEDAIAVLKVDTSSTNGAIQSFNWYIKVENGSVRLSDELENIEDGMVIHEGQWSDNIIRNLEGEDGLYPYRFKAKLFYADGKKGNFKIFFNEAGDAGKYISPSEFKEEVLTIPGIFPNYGHHKYLGSGIDNKTFLEMEAMIFDWQWEVMTRTWENHNVDITVVYSVYIDTINHRYRNIIERTVPASEEEFLAAVELYEDAYKLADGFLGKIMEHVDDDTTIVVVSDHGSVGHNTIINPFVVLEREGLLVYDNSKESGKRKVDWSKTLAYPISTCHVYVNLKGREPHGIVDEKDYDVVVNKIISALQNGFRDEEKGVNSLAFALRREEAGLVGQGGEFSGDVIYGIAGSNVGGYIGGVHACQIPTAKTETGDIRSLLIMAGPMFKEGEVVSRGINLYDAAPTLCYALNYPQPAQVEGAVVFQALKSKQ